MKSSETLRRVKRGEIYYVDFGSQIGSVQGGNRPAVIIQNDIGNRYSPTTIVAAITSFKEKAFMPTHVTIDPPFLRGPAIVLLEQIRTVDKLYISRYLGTLDAQSMAEVDKALRISLQTEGKMYGA